MHQNLTMSSSANNINCKFSSYYHFSMFLLLTYFSPDSMPSPILPHGFSKKRMLQELNPCKVRNYRLADIKVNFPISIDAVEDKENTPETQEIEPDKAGSDNMGSNETDSNKMRPDEWPIRKVSDLSTVDLSSPASPRSCKTFSTLASTIGSDSRPVSPLNLWDNLLETPKIPESLELPANFHMDYETFGTVGDQTPPINLPRPSSPIHEWGDMPETPNLPGTPRIPDTPTLSLIFPENWKAVSTVSTTVASTAPATLSRPCSPVNYYSDMPDSPRSTFTLVHGMPYNHERLLEMGKALDQARRERRFPSTNTPDYNLQAVIDDYEDLQRLDAAREAAGDPKDHAFHPEVSRLYIEIKRRIQDRDLTQGQVAADSNVRARLSGIANGTGAEAGIYNLMRHAVQSVLRLNHLTPETEDNLVGSAATRVVNEIRNSVRTQADFGAHRVDGVNMEAVMEEVFGAIENALSQGIGTQANRLDGQYNRVDSQINNMNSITTAQNAQVNAIASHVSAIDNHVHAMGSNVNAMGSLVTSTNGNVTALSTNIGSLQTIINMLPQMVANSVQHMIPDIVGPAVEQAFEGAITNELLTRLQDFANAVQEARARANAASIPRHETSERPRRSHGRNIAEKGSWFGRLNIFKKHNRRHSSPTCMPTR
jgi:archaellum component FlaC